MTRTARVRDYLSLIKFSHSIFALPFALIAFLVAAGGRVDPARLGLVVVCMVAARAAAMAYNRLIDRRIDAANPRTATREIPAGVISPSAALWFTLAAAALFLAAAWLLAPVCFVLGVPVLVFLLGYSHAKRFTALAHLWLGIALGLAPVAAWVAVRGSVDRSLFAPVLLGAGVALWVAGFDVLYSCQDEDFDRAHGLHSIPARLGRAAALRLSRAAHAVAVVLFVAFGVLAALGWPYHVGVAVVAGVLVWEHRMIHPNDMSRVDMAFFTMNGIVSMVMLVGTVLALV